MLLLHLCWFDSVGIHIRLSCYKSHLLWLTSQILLVYISDSVVLHLMMVYISVCLHLSWFTFRIHLVYMSDSECWHPWIACVRAALYKYPSTHSQTTVRQFRVHEFLR